MAMPQCCYLAKGAKRPSHTTNTIKFDRIPFDPCNSIKRFDLSPFDQKNSTYLQPPQHKPTFLSRTTPDMENTLQNTESLLTTKLIPNITGRGQLSKAERSLFSLPLSKGRLNILSPEDRRNDLQWSKDVTSHLDEEDLTTAEAKQHSTVNMIKKQKQEIQKTKLEEVKCNLNDEQRHPVTLVSEKGASSWLAALPLGCRSFRLMPFRLKI